MDEPDLEIVVVSHGAPDLLRNCLQSLRHHPPAVTSRVTVVDSGSPDGTPAMVERDFPEVRLIRLDNVGFSAANNRVLREAFDSGGAAMYLLLNPDTEVREGTLDVAIERLRSDPSVGMVGVRLETADGNFDHASKRAFPTPLAAFAHFTGIGRLNNVPASLSQYRATWLDEHEPGPVDAVNGAFMLVRREALTAAGLLDEGYWLYMEDLDWCRRFGEAGWTVFYEPAGTALHVKGGSSPARRRIRQEVAFHRGMGRFYRRFESREHTVPVNFAVYLGIAAKLVASLLITAVSNLAGSRYRG